jgi:hypothetical protein
MNKLEFNRRIAYLEYISRFQPECLYDSDIKNIQCEKNKILNDNLYNQEKYGKIIENITTLQNNQFKYKQSVKDKNLKKCDRNREHVMSEEANDELDYYALKLYYATLLRNVQDRHKYHSETILNREEIKRYRYIYKKKLRDFYVNSRYENGINDEITKIQKFILNKTNIDVLECITARGEKRKIPPSTPVFSPRTEALIHDAVQLPSFVLPPSVRQQAWRNPFTPRTGRDLSSQPNIPPPPVRRQTWQNPLTPRSSRDFITTILTPSPVPSQPNIPPPPPVRQAWQDPALTPRSKQDFMTTILAPSPLMLPSQPPVGNDLIDFINYRPPPSTQSKSSNNHQQGNAFGLPRHAMTKYQFHQFIHYPSFIPWFQRTSKQAKRAFKTLYKQYYSSINK